jgi:hypothetical protein
MSKMAQHQADLEAQPEGVKRLSHLEKTVPVEKFVLWKQRQCKQSKDSTSVSSDYVWLVPSLSFVHL